MPRTQATGCSKDAESTNDNSDVTVLSLPSISPCTSRSSSRTWRACMSRTIIPASDVANAEQARYCVTCQSHIMVKSHLPTCSIQSRESPSHVPGWKKMSSVEHSWNRPKCWLPLSKIQVPRVQCEHIDYKTQNTYVRCLAQSGSTVDAARDRKFKIENHLATGNRDPCDAHAHMIQQVS